jgi:nanoRNase/pAp phosphatase (c-di-AMP/oligoRNAs hydrolase)
LSASIFRDSLDLKQLQVADKLELTLVDHHVLSPETEFLRMSVVEIIDHHPQDPAWQWPEQKVTLTNVGSCSTLVANEVVLRCPQLLNHEVALLLYGECTALHHFLEQAAGALFIIETKVLLFLGCDVDERVWKCFEVF